LAVGFWILVFWILVFVGRKAMQTLSIKKGAEAPFML